METTKPGPGVLGPGLPGPGVLGPGLRGPGVLGPAIVAAFAAAYAVTAIAGRYTVIDGTDQPVLWPAAGVAVVWLGARLGSRRLWVDAVLLGVINLAVDLVTGTTVPHAALYTAANLVQAGIFLALLAQFCPELRGAGGDQLVTRVWQLWWIIVAATTAATTSAFIGPVLADALTGTPVAINTALWIARNVVGIVMIGGAGMGVLHLYTLLGPPGGRIAKLRAAVVAVLRNLGGYRLIEHVAMVMASVAAYIVAFPADHGLPLAFPLLAFTVWAGLRTDVAFVMLHSLVFGRVAVYFTIHGDGPFAAIGTPAARALVAQLFVGMLAVVGMALALGRKERAALLAQLATAENAAREQARLLTTIVDTMSDGLAVVDADGRFVMSNPAVRRLLGGTAALGTTTDGSTSGAPFAGPEEYGLYHPDGTPIRREELGFVRALAGEKVRDMDLLVRNAGVPGGRLISLSATALPGPVGNRVVMVSRDVTAERRHREELASFAGVVAHDLLAPLTVVEAWTETLADAVHAAPGNAEMANLGAGIARIERAGARMRDLIHDLLAYTTARDAAMAVQRVSLDDLVGDIVAIRQELPSGPAGTPTPVFHLDRLAEVEADPALLRQVMENLIGNAIKYTEPGTVPDISVSTAEARPGWIRVEVADRGIGIPGGERLAVFKDFHRAHTNGGYAGSGLGLAICKRIVERHGGTISVDGNPGGGSVFFFTVPAVRRPAADPPAPFEMAAAR